MWECAIFLSRRCCKRVAYGYIVFDLSNPKSTNRILYNTLISYTFVIFNFKPRHSVCWTIFVQVCPLQYNIWPNVGTLRWHVRGLGSRATTFITLRPNLCAFAVVIITSSASACASSRSTDSCEHVVFPSFRSRSLFISCRRWLCHNGANLTWIWVSLSPIFLPSWVTSEKQIYYN